MCTGAQQAQLRQPADTNSSSSSLAAFVVSTFPQTSSSSLSTFRILMIISCRMVQSSNY